MGDYYFNGAMIKRVDVNNTPGSQKQKTEKKKERAKVGDNNGQATHGARKPPGPIKLI